MQILYACIEGLGWAGEVSLHTFSLGGVWGSKLEQGSWMHVAECIQSVELGVSTHAWVLWSHAQIWLGHAKNLPNKGECSDQ